MRCCLDLLGSLKTYFVCLFQFLVNNDQFKTQDLSIKQINKNHS